MSNIQPIRIMVIVLAGMLCGTYALLFFTVPYLVMQAAGAETLRNEQTLLSMQIVATSNVLLYATVTGIDPVLGSIEVMPKNPFDVSQPMAPFHISVASPAYIAKQELSGSNGVFTSLSREATTTLSSIAIGDRVAVLVSRASDGTAFTHYILFGNPL